METSINFFNILPNETYVNIVLDMFPVELNKILRLSSQLYNRIRHDKYFWKTKLLRDFGVETTEEDTYLGYRLRFTNNNLYDSLCASARQGHLGLFKYIYTMMTRENMEVRMGTPIKEAIFGNHINIINYITDLGFDGCNTAMKYSAQVCNKELVQYFISRGARNWYAGLYGALQGNCNELIHFFVEKGAKNRNNNMYLAALAGNIDFVDYFITNGADDLNRGLAGAARGNHKELVDFFIHRGAQDLRGALINATTGMHLEMIKYIVDKGAGNFNDALNVAVKLNQMSIIDYFISMGANDFIESFRQAALHEYYNLVKMFQIMGNIDVRQVIETFYNQGQNEAARYLEKIYNIT